MRWIMVAAWLLAISAGVAEAKVRYAGGDGSSIAKAVKILGAGDSLEGIRSEYQWLAKNKPNCRRGSQALLDKGKTFYDVLTIRCGSKSVDVYFDITDFFGTY